MKINGKCWQKLLSSVNESFEFNEELEYNKKNC